jgi:hypothetical protein
MKEKRQEENLKDEMKTGRTEQMDIKKEMRKQREQNMKQKKK